LLLNDEKLSLREARLGYKHQPGVENEQLKTVFKVMPVNLKSPSRIEALFFIYFMAVLAESLIEREIRRIMKKEKAVALPLHAEGPPARRPPQTGYLKVSHDTACQRQRLGAEALLRPALGRPVTCNVLLYGREGSCGRLTGERNSREIRSLICGRQGVTSYMDDLQP
jgi:hypothetical protein